MDKKKRRLITRTLILCLLGAALLYALYTNFTKEKNDQLQIGEQAPNFVLTDMNGKQHKLSEYRGRGVFLNFWGTWCKPCEYEMPYIEKQYQVYKNQGVEVLAINVGESDYAVNNFAVKYHLSFPIMIDKGQEVQIAYQVNPLPVTFLIDKEGKVVDMTTGSLTEASVQQYMERIKP